MKTPNCECMIDITNSRVAIRRNFRSLHNQQKLKKVSESLCAKCSMCDNIKESPSHQAGRVAVSRKRPLSHLRQPFRAYLNYAQSCSSLKQHNRAKVRDKFTLLSYVSVSFLAFYFLENDVHSYKQKIFHIKKRAITLGKELTVHFLRHVAIRSHW